MRYAAITACAVVLALAAMAEDSVTLSRGLQLLGAKDYAQAQVVLAKVVAAEPENKEAWLALGQSLQEQGKHAEAVEAFNHAQGAAGVIGNRALFRRAQSLAMVGRKDDALRDLKKLADKGYPGVAMVESSANLASLRSDPGYRQVVEKMDRNAYPCKYDPRYRAFDFWVGEWEVRPVGHPEVPPAHSLIQRTLGDCVIFENYTDSSGAYTGKSFNAFDAMSGHWKQVYVDSGGTVHEWDGEVRDGVMYYVGANLDEHGGRSWDRITYRKLENGHVRHTSEQSTDGGRTWNTYFDGEYTPVKR